MDEPEPSAELLEDFVDSVEELVEPLSLEDEPLVEGSLDSFAGSFAPDELVEDLDEERLSVL